LVFPRGKAGIRSLDMQFPRGMAGARDWAPLGLSGSGLRRIEQELER
jgi:hypothetical protein